MENTRLSQIALHESAHLFAVIFYAKKLYGDLYLFYDDETTFKDKRIHPGGDPRERDYLTIIPDPNGEFLGCMKWHQTSSLHPHIEARVTIAGYAVDLIGQDDPNYEKFVSEHWERGRLNEGSDYDQLTIYAGLNTEPDDNGFVDVVKVLTPILKEVVGDMKTHWSILEEVADLLLEKKVINGLELHDLAIGIFNRLPDLGEEFLLFAP